jgi:hypothetical protein
VSVYAFESGRREVVVVWPGTVGSRAQVVAPLPAAVSEDLSAVI